MDKDKILEIVNNVSDQTNKTLIDTRNFLSSEFDKTKETIIKLTRHMDAVEKFYNTINDEIGKRTK